MFSLYKHLEMKFKEDIYITRVRSGYSYLMLNSSYDGIRIIDCVSGEEKGTISFPEPDFSIYTWVVSPEGNKSYLFSPDETDYALELDLEKNSVRKIGLSKGFQAPTELCWFNPEFHILDYRDLVWTLKNNTFVKADLEAASKYYTNKFKRIINKFVVNKMEPSGRGLYVRSRKSTKYIGYLPLLEGQDVLKGILMEQDGNAIDIAHYKENLFIAFESEVVQYRCGETDSILRITEEEYFVRVNIIIKDEIGYLCVLSSTKDHLTDVTGTITIYQLQPGSSV